MFTRSRAIIGRTGPVSLRFLSGEANPNVLKTSLHDWHVEQGGKMIDFAGYLLPVLYEGAGVMKEHLHTRTDNACSLFDVSHMGQIKWSGSDAVAFLEKVTVGDIKSLGSGDSKLSLIMNAVGGIVDDTVITNAGDYLYMVVNGACKHKDIDHFKRYMSDCNDLHMEHMQEQQLLALQGKAAQRILERLTPGLDLSRMPFMTSTEGVLAGIPVRITRCGYTGEDGFELSVSAAQAVELASILVSHPEVKPAGLGARDSLRMEAGLCLYGDDLDDATNPVEAGLVWTMGGPKGRRRTEQGFLGASIFLEPTGKLKKMSRKRVGIAGMKAPARGSTEIFSGDGKTKIGEVTSGGFGPSFKAPVAIGYISTNYNGDDKPAVKMNIRGKMTDAEIVKMPFVPTSYYKLP
jgi:aminomethyltransferase